MCVCCCFLLLCVCFVSLLLFWGGLFLFRFLTEAPFWPGGGGGGGECGDLQNICQGVSLGNI